MWTTEGLHKADISILLVSLQRSHSHLRTLHSDGSGSTASVSLRCQNLVVVASELKSILGPRIKVRLDIDSAADPLLLPDTPELGECAGTLDRRLVDTSRLQDVVGAAVNGNSSLLACCRSRVVGTVRLDDVVLDERVLGPAVKGDVRVDRPSVPGTAVGNGAACSGLPSLAGDEVADVGPSGGIFATGLFMLVYILLVCKRDKSHLVVVGH